MLVQGNKNPCTYIDAIKKQAEDLQKENSIEFMVAKKGEEIKMLQTHAQFAENVIVVMLDTTQGEVCDAAKDHNMSTMTSKKFYNDVFPKLSSGMVC